MADSLTKKQASYKLYRRMVAWQISVHLAKQHGKTCANEDDVSKQGCAHDYGGARAQSQKRAVHARAQHMPHFFPALMTQYVD